MVFEAQSLACRRSLRPVFRNVGFALDSGGALLVTGPNGSGKSSLLRVLAGLLPAAGGAVWWDGAPVDWSQHRTHLHYLGHHDALKPELTLAETVAYWRALRKQKGDFNLSEQFGLDALRDRPVRTLSAGQKRRVALARLALEDVPLWLLDEPATSLDATGQNLLAQLIAQHRAKGGIAIIATHHGMHIPGAQHLALDGAGT